jgi:L-ascorbate metabolism protein UlaG (beta-lactamase superfamily)
MKVKWLGHSSFLITSDEGIRVITDPYTSGGDLGYTSIAEKADIVTVSHDHFDHNNVSSVRGNPEVITQGKTAKGIEFRAVHSYHDESGGSKRGTNTIFCFRVSGVALCHLGDLGHPLSDGQATEIGGVDVLFIPVGGYFTVDAEIATGIYRKLEPAVVIPMHYKNNRCSFPIDGIDDFLAGKENVRRLDTSEVEFMAGEMPGRTQIIVLKPAL